MALLHAEIVRLGLKHAWTIARGTSTEKFNVIVRLQKDGITGLGEAAPNTRYDETAESCVAFIEQAKPLFRGANLWQYHDLSYRIQGLAAGQTAAKAALDIALMDWVCKSLDVPLYRFLGLDAAKTPLTTMSIGIAEPVVMAQRAQEVADFPVLKIKLGGGNDEAIINAIRAVTDRPLRVDANEGWHDVEQAIDKIHWLEAQGVEFVEQPLPSSMLREIALVRARVNLPLIADESVKQTKDIPALADAFDGINIKIMKSGGLQEALRMITLARASGMSIMLGCMCETSIAISAAAALSPLVDYADLDGNLLLQEDPFRGVQVKQGKLILNELPGIGVIGEMSAAARRDAR